RKCGKQVRRYLGPQRDVCNEVSHAASEDDSAASAALAREPTPEETARAAELLEQCLRPLDERERQVLLLELQGWTAREVAERVSMTRYTIEGIRKRIRQRLRHLREDAGDS